MTDPTTDPTTDRWQRRIVSQGSEDPQQLLANPRNWRVHPLHQQDELAQLLTKVGWVQPVVVNQRSGHVVDGHLRVQLAISREEPTVPVVYVDLDEDEERLALATFDPIGEQAIANEGALDSLLAELGHQGLAEHSLHGVPREPAPAPSWSLSDEPDEPEREIEVTCPHCGKVFSLDLRLLRAEATVAIVIMARLERRESAERIADALGGTVVYDPEPDAPPSPAGHWRAYRHSWLEGAKLGETHVLVLEDDVIPCRHFRQAAESALAVRPDEPVTFFSRTAAVQEAFKQGDAWARPARSAFRGTPAVSLPTPLAKQFVEWCDNEPELSAPEKKGPDGDVRLAEWLKHHKLRMWATVPSLIEHPTRDKVASLIPHHTNDRQASLFIGTNNDDALELDWTRGL